MGFKRARWLLIGWITGATALGSSGEAKFLDPREVSREFEIRSWRHEHGLPDGRVWGITQSRDGYLWIATRKGLARFDGQQFVTFDHTTTPELANEECDAVAADSDGSVWITTPEALIRKNGNRFWRYANPQKLGPGEHPALAAREGGGAWVSGEGKLLLAQGEQVQEFRLADDLPNSPVRINALVEQGKSVWLGTSAGLLRFDTARKHFEFAPASPELAGLEVFGLWPSSPTELSVLLSEARPAIHVPFPNLLLARLSDGRLSPLRFDPIAGIRSTLAPGFLTGDSSGALWFQCGRDLISRFADGQVQGLPFSQEGKGDFVLCAFIDRQDNLWIGKDTGGLERWAPRRFSSYAAEDGLANDNTWSICQRKDGTVIVGTDGGLSRFSNRRFSPFLAGEGAALTDVRAVAEDTAGCLWIGTMRSLERSTDGSRLPTPLPGEWFDSKIRALHAGRDGSMWIGTVRGLTRLKGAERTKHTTADGLGAEEVRAILEDKSGDVWVGTLGGGLSRLHDGQFSSLTKKEGLPSNNVWALCESAGGAIWIGTDEGLARWKDGDVTSFGTREGLPSGEVNCFVIDDANRLWIGHDQGIYWVAMAQLEEVAVGRRSTVEAIQYDESDGLLSTETNGQKSNPTACRTQDGRLWFPTTKGVAIVDPSRVAIDATESLAALEEVQANGTRVAGDPPLSAEASEVSPPPTSSGARLRLPPGSARILRFRYTANTFLAPEKARFRYRLIGLDDHWIDAGSRREAFFNDLRPGNYTFEVAARSHHGVWQTTPVTFAFEIVPFFHQTWGFYLLSGTVAAVLIGLGMAWRAREQRRTHQLEQLHALEEQRRRIARDIHDELGASLTHILQISSETSQDPSQSQRVQAQAKRISRLADEAVDQIGEIVWANNPEYDTLEDLVAYIREYAGNFFAETEIVAAFEFPETIPSRTVSGLFRRHLVMVLKEALQNIVKHSGASRVTFRLELENERFELAISDNGRGLPGQEATSSGNGLANMRHRISELNGTFRISCLPDRGTEVRITVPMAKN